MTTKKEKELVGTIFTSTVAKGSKHEHEACYLRRDDGSQPRVQLQGENPFEQPTLKKHAGKRVRLIDCTQIGDDLWRCAQVEMLGS